MPTQYSKQKMERKNILFIDEKIDITIRNKIQKI